MYNPGKIHEHLHLSKGYCILVFALLRNRKDQSQVKSRKSAVPLSNTKPVCDWKSCLTRTGVAGTSVSSRLLSLESCGPMAHCMASLPSAVLRVELFARELWHCEHWHQVMLVPCLMLSSSQLMFFLQTDDCILNIKASSSLENHTKSKCDVPVVNKGQLK